MRYLKNKVARALQRQQSPTDCVVKREDSDLSQSNLFPYEKLSVKQDSALLSRSEASISIRRSLSSPSDRNYSRKDGQSNKNIVKNYARAMVNFALSPQAVTYLEILLKQEKITLQEFRQFVKSQKAKINSIKNLRGLLLTSDDDDCSIATYKKVFREVCEVFVKFFSVNWIFNSKLGDRMTHLRYRFKILRRVRNPEYFTYLEDFNKKI